MTITLSLIFLVIACICFFLSAVTIPVSPRLNLTALGLFFWTLSLLVGGAAR